MSEKRAVNFPCASVVEEGLVWLFGWRHRFQLLFFLSFNQTLVCKMSGLLKLDLCAYFALNTPMLNHNHSYCQANCDGHVVEFSFDASIFVYSNNLIVVHFTKCTLTMCVSHPIKVSPSLAIGIFFSLFFFF